MTCKTYGAGNNSINTGRETTNDNVRHSLMYMAVVARTKYPIAKNIPANMDTAVR